MFFFYRYRVIIIKKNYRQAWRLQQYTSNWARWYVLSKFNAFSTRQVPQLRAWLLRSLYTFRLHFKQQRLTYKAILLHLFWILDLWQLKYPLVLQGFSKQYPIRCETIITNSLQVNAAFTKWLSLYSLNKDKVLPYKISTNWLNYRPQIWIVRSYHYYNYWYLLGKQHLDFRQRSKYLWFLNRWYLENGNHHRVQHQVVCYLPVNLPLHYTKILWLRLLRYPCLYNYQWFVVLKQLAVYAWSKPLPWSLIYGSGEVRTLNLRTKGLLTILKALISQRMQITEHIFIKRWKDLLVGTDKVSSIFQIFIRQSIFFRQYFLSKGGLNAIK